MSGRGDDVGEKPSVEEGSGLDRAAATTESLPRTMMNLEWGKAACSEETIKKWMATEPFAPGDLVEWRAPLKDEPPSPSAMGDQFVILSLTHIMCGLRLDASDFLVSVLAHYGIEWAHLSPNSITVLSIFAHMCEAYLGVAPTLEVFDHFYRLYPNNKGESATLGGVYFRLRDKMKRNYPAYYLKASQVAWNSLWFYAKLLPRCPLTFRGDALKEMSSWKDSLLLSPEQEKQVRRIEELSNQGLTGVDIVRDYLKHRISPLRRRAHLACKYTGPTDPTRDSFNDLSAGDILNKLSYLLDLNKTGKKEPPNRCSAPASLVGASADERTNQHLGLLEAPSTHEGMKKMTDKIRALAKTIKYSKRTQKPLGPPSSGRYTRQSAGPKKFMLLSSPRIDSSLIRGHLQPGEEILEATTPITTAASPNCGMEPKSKEHLPEIEEGTRAELTKPISSITTTKRKSLANHSGSQRKAQRSVLTIVPKNRIMCLDNGSVKWTSSTEEAVTALDLQSPGLARPSPTSSVKDGENSALLILANVVVPNKVSEDSVSNVLLDQPVSGSPSKEVDHAQSMSEGVQNQKAVDESAAIPVPNPEKIASNKVSEDFVSNVLLDQPVSGSPSKEVDHARSMSKGVQNQKAVSESAAIPVPNPEKITSDVILEQMQIVQSEFVAVAQATSSELLQQAKKLVMENRRLNGGRIMLEQQVKDLQDNRRLLIDSLEKATQEARIRTEENAELRDEIRAQKKTTNELRNQNETTQFTLVRTCAELKRLKAEAAQVVKDKEELQLRVSRVNELHKQMTRALCHGEDEENGDLTDANC